MASGLFVVFQLSYPFPPPQVGGNGEKFESGNTNQILKLGKSCFRRAFSYSLPSRMYWAFFPLMRQNCSPAPGAARSASRCIPSRISSRSPFTSRPFRTTNWPPAMTAVISGVWAGAWR